MNFHFILEDNAHDGQCRTEIDQQWHQEVTDGNDLMDEYPQRPMPRWIFDDTYRATSIFDASKRFDKDKFIGSRNKDQSHSAHH